MPARRRRAPFRRQDFPTFPRSAIGNALASGANIEIVRAVIDAFGGRDRDGALHFFDPSAKVRTVATSAHAQPAHPRPRRKRSSCGERDGELAAADPGRQVARAHGAADRGSDRAQHDIAGCAAVLVVDGLEGVDVDGQDRAVRTRRGLRQRAQRVLERTAVVEVRERIAERQVAEVSLAGGASARTGAGAVITSQ
ncbi:MAG: hypothetical protein WKF94_11665 [Solirubrobacteraceae bacterium]